MRSTASSHTVESCVEGVRAQAVKGPRVPPDVAAEAARATIRALRCEPNDARLALRVRSYFWAVVRRSLVRRRSAPELSARFVLSTVAADLVEAGRSPAAIWDEILRGWADKVPGDVLDEYRVRLCA